jgi:hypothetical protein
MLRYDAIGQSPDNIYCNIQVVNKKEEPAQFNYYDSLPLMFPIFDW